MTRVPATLNPLLVLVVFLVFAGCAHEGGMQKAAPAVAAEESFAKLPLPEKKNSLAAVYRDAEALAGRIVDLDGTFEGWSRCTDDSTILTRSDWVFRDSSACVFVTGGFPTGLQPSEKADRGTPLSIRAEVLYARGKLTLQLMETLDVGVK